jgi:adenylate kinase
MSDKSKKMVILMFGPPGAGKGTQGNQLLDEFNLMHLSTGDSLREAVQQGSELGKKAKEYMDGGELVPDDLIIPIIEEKLKQNSDKGFLFDGFPRTTPQAEMLENALEHLGLEVERVIYLNAGRDTILERLTGRRVCPDCGATYHVTNIPPKTAGVCDQCGAGLIQRVDDTEETILNRLDVYNKQTAGVLSYYRDKGKLLEIDGALPIDETYPKISASLR